MFRGSCNPYYGICIPKKLRRLWIWIELVSYIIVFVLKMYVIPKIFRYSVVAERNPIDFLIWLVITLRSSDIVKSYVLPIVIVLAIHSCRNIYIRADLDVLKTRRKYEDYLLEQQLKIYDRISQILSIPFIDTTHRKPIDSFKELLQLLYREVRGR